MAKFLAERGARLALVDLDIKKLESFAANIAAEGVDVRCYRANVADEAQVTRTYELVVADFGGLDVSIANAGILRDGLLVKAKDGKVTQKMSIDDFGSWARSLGSMRKLML